MRLPGARSRAAASCPRCRQAAMFSRSPRSWTAARGPRFAIDGVDRERRPGADGGRQHRTDHDRHGGRHPSRRGVADGGPRRPDRLRGGRRRRIFIAERAGRIRVFRDGRLQPAALEIDDVVASGRRGLLALALDPDFERTGHVFAAYTADSGFRLVRYRASGDTLGESATLLDGVDSTLATPSATLRFGPDGKLYLGLDDSGDPSRPGDLGSFNGKVLRLNPDGTTPSDQAAGTPVYALNVNEPRGLEWDGPTLWVAESLRLQGLADAAATARRATAMVELPAAGRHRPRGHAVLPRRSPPRSCRRSAGGERGRRRHSAPAVRPEQSPQDRVERVPAERRRRPESRALRPGATASCISAR